MAVYKRGYRGYDGALTPAWSRFLILRRYSYRRLFQSRFLTAFLVLCLFYPLGCAVFIYLSHNLGFLAELNVQVSKLIEINGRFFLFSLQFQGVLAYLLTAFVGPSLIAPDMANNALPLYFCRPLSRTEYVLGKMSVLLLLLSSITWIPGLILFVIQASLAGWAWTAANWWIAGAIVVGGLVWIVILSLIALALSAWVKWKIAAGALVLAVFFAGAGFGAAINAVMRTQNGTFFDLAGLIARVWAGLFRVERDSGIAVADAWSALLAVSTLCVWLLSRKVRAYEVVK